MNLYFIQIIEHNIERDGYIEREREFDEERTIYLKREETYKSKKKKDQYKFKFYEDLRIYCETIGM